MELVAPSLSRARVSTIPRLRAAPGVARAPLFVRTTTVDGKGQKARAALLVADPAAAPHRNHAGRPWETVEARASASILARSARVAWCKRDFAVPTGIPARPATSEIDRPR